MYPSALQVSRSSHRGRPPATLWDDGDDRDSPRPTVVTLTERAADEGPRPDGGRAGRRGRGAARSRSRAAAAAASSTRSASTAARRRATTSSSSTASRSSSTRSAPRTCRARRSTSWRRSRSPGSRSTTRTSPPRAAAGTASRSPRAEAPEDAAAAAPAAATPTELPQLASTPWCQTPLRAKATVEYRFSERGLGSRRERRPSRRRRRLGPGRVLRRRRAPEERGADGRGRRARPAADAVGARAARRRPRPREHQGRLARVREDRRAARLPLLRQRRGRVARSATRSSSRSYDAVVYTVGAQTDRRLGIPGEDLPGSWPATAFVAWYNGHPDFQDCAFDLSHERAVVVGNGNVAIDCARMLALTAEELAPTDTVDGGDRGDLRRRRRGDRDARPARARCRRRSRRRS